MDPSSDPWYKPPLVTAMPDVSDFPPLVDDTQFTLAATFPQNDRYTSASARIGRYYRQGLHELDDAGLEQRRTERTAPPSPLKPTVKREGWAAGLPCRPLLPPMLPAGSDGSAAPPPAADDFGASALGILRRQRGAARAAASVPFADTYRTKHITDAEKQQQRMAAYVEGGVDEATLAPYNNTWVEAAMEQVPTELGGVEEGQMNQILGEMVGEIHTDYYTAVKQSMLEYLLKSAAESKRLEIMAPPPKFELNTFHPSQDPSVAECCVPKARRCAPFAARLRARTSRSAHTHTAAADAASTHAMHA